MIAGDCGAVALLDMLAIVDREVLEAFFEFEAECLRSSRLWLGTPLTTLLRKSFRML
jgi:hypothetical protein